jgi:hypothetical protein
LLFISYFLCPISHILYLLYSIRQWIAAFSAGKM